MSNSNKNIEFISVEDRNILRNGVEIFDNPNPIIKRLQDKEQHYSTETEIKDITLHDILVTLAFGERLPNIYHAFAIKFNFSLLNNDYYINTVHDDWIERAMTFGAYFLACGFSVYTAGPRTPRPRREHFPSFKDVDSFLDCVRHWCTDFCMADALERIPTSILRPVVQRDSEALTLCLQKIKSYRFIPNLSIVTIVFYALRVNATKVLKASMDMLEYIDSPHELYYNTAISFAEGLRRDKHGELECDEIPFDFIAAICEQNKYEAFKILEHVIKGKEKLFFINAQRYAELNIPETWMERLGKDHWLVVPKDYQQRLVPNVTVVDGRNEWWLARII